MAAGHSPIEESGSEPGPPPDPRNATDLVEFVALLAELWVWAGRPGFKKRLEELARDHPKVGRGQLSGSTAHRVVTGKQDLTTMVGGPERFVRAFVTTLGADPEPWLTVLRGLLGRAAAEANPVVESETNEPRAPRAPVRSLLRSRRVQVIAAVLILITGALVVWGVLDRSTRATPISAVDYSRSAVIQSANSGLRVAIDQGSDQTGARAVVVDSGNSAATWEVVAPYRNNAGYRQIRPAGKLLMCLEVVGGSFQDRAAVQQWACNGEPHQYWKIVPGPSGSVRFENLNSGQCLSVAGSRPQAGMQLVQRECDEQEARQWHVTPSDTPPPTSPPSASITPGAVGPDPAEYPGGGRDRPCAGLSPVVDPATKPWSSQPVLIRNEDATRGKATLGPEGAGAVELMRANVRNADGVDETFYWAEGFVKFTPRQFSMALQWTTVPGPGGWHTCTVAFDTEHGRPQTVALPRDSDHNGARDVWFRVCLSYEPERAGTGPVVSCTGRY